MATHYGDLRGLKDLLAKLPEIYQQIYEHPEFDLIASRRGDGRLAELRNVVTALQQHLGRPLRILDLGCAQGWVSLHLAAAGAFVLGIDHYEPNIAVCNKLASEHLRLPVRFERADLAQLPERLDIGDFDLFLGLSVFHHLCSQFGKEWVRDLIGRFLEKVPHAILEIALASELPAWAKAQPENPEFFFEGLPHFTLLAHSPTHLHSQRPLYFCSRTVRLHEGHVTDLDIEAASAPPAPAVTVPATVPFAGKRKMIMLAGINGAGKTLVAFRLARRLAGVSSLYSEDSDEATASGLDIDHSAFNRAFVERLPLDRRPLHRAIVDHCVGVIRNFPLPPQGSTIIVDRWYETYVDAAELPPAAVDEIENAIADADIEGYLINLVIDDDFATAVRHLEHTRAHRPPDWWKPELGSIEDRASGDLVTQRKIRRLGLATRLHYAEINTTAMQWDEAAERILDLVQPAMP